MQSIKFLSLVWLFFIPQSKANSAFNLDSQNYSVKHACVRTNYDEGASSNEGVDTTRLACPTCKGRGTIEKKCSACAGTGKSPNISQYRMKHDIDYWVCTKCRGIKKWSSKCVDCDGTGNHEDYVKRFLNQTLHFLNLRFMCEPCVHSKIYEHFGFIGSGIINGNVIFDNGRFVNYSSQTSTPSNGWYNYHVTCRRTDIIYMDSMVQMNCVYTSYGSMTPNGSPASNWKREEPKIKNGIDKAALYMLHDGKATSKNLEIEYVNDSTIIDRLSENGHYRKYIIANNHVSITTPSEGDMWNVEMWLENGFPVRIKDYSGDRYFRYIAFDSHSNWVKKEEVDVKKQIIKTIERKIDYND